MAAAVLVHAILIHGWLFAKSVRPEDGSVNVAISPTHFEDTQKENQTHTSALLELGEDEDANMSQYEYVQSLFDNIVTGSEDSKRLMAEAMGHDRKDAEAGKITPDNFNSREAQFKAGMKKMAAKHDPSEDVKFDSIEEDIGKINLMLASRKQHPHLHDSAESKKIEMMEKKADSVMKMFEKLKDLRARRDDMNVLQSIGSQWQFLG
mmetsp:Transcript_28136/g.45240  ORF Transcript_28136/g.45240 Transcript_28136/m.45240 type:complete len:207 (+) Transcript_28136:49-669(+)